MAQVEKKETTEIKATEIKKELTFDDKVLEKIIGFSVEKVDGLLTVDGGFFSNLTGKILNNDDVTTGINVEVGKTQVAIDLSIVVEFGKNIPELVDQLVKIVSENIKKMTGLELIEVNIKVADIKTKEQHEEDSVTLQDKLSKVTDQATDAISDQTEKAKNSVSKAASNVKEQVANGRVQ
ncbi:Asp23/Gls24 family envelope stress response protein [Enterococcus ureasiticus]|uniref:Asp23/Gls24 family envelope stress response protein n=1 Tax=Enterococcus ureasiticus TaxID=903984 RepID=UPI001A8C2961|nr:Asp23/Gls24 family envelope stress response protein [Enterococcus ureasiticus]MBO0473614.1 Asp23/Gls24 family envelope stress response protein [Enterococcus ureasiticus]